jgi:hypothetical protein
MPFCRKCGRRLIEYSKSCSECGTSTTAPMIKIKKAPAAYMDKTVAPEKVAKAIVPVEIISFPKKILKNSLKSITSTKSVKTTFPAKSISTAKQIITVKPFTPAKVYPEHEIIKSNVSLKEDLAANPQDYETQTFGFDLRCPNGHFWSAGKALPVSNGKALCLKCGEMLRKPKPNKHQKYRRF